jgi:two-component system cell cycle sensor histidine kinase/response regulator CckA
MIGFSDLLLMRHPAGDPSFADIMQIKQNANRAANLVRQLLAFSRRQTLQPKTIDLTEVLAELSNLIRRLIGENIQMTMQHGRDLGMVKADQGQLEQVIINLAVNARDAMKDGGTLTIRTSNLTVSADDPLPHGFIAPTEEDVITAGDYVLVEVSDSGTGIPPEIVKNIFEPFFSTKEVGSGTGLGLSTCYGIIKQTGGYIAVKTELGVGTTFHLYFKRFEAEQRAANAPDNADEKSGGDLTGRATILLVEDETPVRIFAARALRNKGYEVLEADSGENALEVFAENNGSIDLIISDVMMPGINGPKMIATLYENHAERMKDVRVIFISGYAEDAFVDSFGNDRTFNFMPKPFTLKQLASKAKEVLELSDAQAAQ